MLEKLTRDKTVTTVCLIYSALTFLLPYKRVLLNWEEGRPASTIIFHTASLWMGVAFIVPVITVATWPESSGFIMGILYLS